jgi:hypothetical protein
MWRNTGNSLRLRWCFLALIGLSLLLALGQTAPPAQPFQRLDVFTGKNQIIQPVYPQAGALAPDGRRLAIATVVVCKTATPKVSRG